MQVVQLDLTKEGLEHLEASDRTLLLLLGHASNEMMVFQKLILQTRKSGHCSGVAALVDSAQAMILVRVLIGKVDEAYKLLDKRVLSDKRVSAEYLPLLDPAGSEALRDLKKHFGKGSPLSQIRNKLSFHYTDEDEILDRHFHDLPHEYPWYFYLPDLNGMPIPIGPVSSEKSQICQPVEPP